MVSTFTNVRVFSKLAISAAIMFAMVAAPLAESTSCQAPTAKPIYLTLDTGNMRDAQAIADILKRHQIRATFFVANEPSWPDRKFSSLEQPWQSYWQERVKEGHAFGSHTWRHGFFSQGKTSSTVTYKPQFGAQAGQALQLDQAQTCAEIKQPSQAFEALTGQPLAGIWRAPGGRTTPTVLDFAQKCGYSHVHWAPAGFLGDELPSDKYPNAVLLQRALRDIRTGDILMAHLGIWSRKERFIEIFEPLMKGLKDRGFCFATLAEHPNYRQQFVAKSR